MTAKELDEWRWDIARSLQAHPTVSGFDPRKDKIALAWLTEVITEYRRLVVEDQRPAQRGPVAQST